MKNVILQLILTFFSLISTAQITLVRSDFAQNGNEYPLAVDFFAENNPVSIDSYGWDFSNLNVDYIDTTRFVDPLLTEYSGIFPDANMSMIEGNGLISFLKVDENSVQLIGLIGDFIGLGDPMVFPLSDPVTIMQFPATIGAFFSNEVVNTIKFPYNESELVDSVSVDLTFKIDNIISDYGVVITPFGNFESLKEWSQRITLIDNPQARFLGFWVPLTGNLLDLLPEGIEFPMSDTISAYNWLGKEQGLPLISANLDLQENVRSITYLYKEPVAVILEATEVSCFGESTGSVCAIVSGGTPPYTYLWEGGEAGSCIENLTAGEYHVIVSDAVENSVENWISVTEPTELQVSFSVTEITEDGNDGAIDITVEGGNPPYMYHWSNESTDEDLSGLDYGDYIVTVTDANNCTITEEIRLIPVGIELFTSNGIKIFPNPVHDILYFSGTGKSYKVQIFDLSGRNVDVISNFNSINMSNLQQGLYILRLTESISERHFVFQIVKN